jgi:hypothetical protein
MINVQPMRMGLPLKHDGRRRTCQCVLVTGSDSKPADCRRTVLFKRLFRSEPIGVARSRLLVCFAIIRLNRGLRPHFNDALQR